LLVKATAACDANDSAKRWSLTSNAIAAPVAGRHCKRVWNFSPTTLTCNGCSGNVLQLNSPDDISARGADESSLCTLAMHPLTITHHSRAVQKGFFWQTPERKRIAGYGTAHADTSTVTFATQLFCRRAYSTSQLM